MLLISKVYDLIIDKIIDSNKLKSKFVNYYFKFSIQLSKLNYLVILGL